MGSARLRNDWLWAALPALALLAWTAAAYPPLTIALVLTSLAWFGVSLWSSRILLGVRATWHFVAIAAVLGWFAEEMGSRYGWFFGDYDYTRVLGPQLGTVPIVIPLMWFALCQGALVMASLLFWRQVLPAGGRRAWLLAAAMTALLVTAFDLGADPYFVFQLEAWVMEKKDGYWFGETVVGFAGWLFVSFTVTALFLAWARPQLAVSATASRRRHAALAPIAVYAAMMAFQVAVGDPFELRVVSFFAMGVPALAAAVAWSQWDGAAAPVPAEARA